MLFQIIKCIWVIKNEMPTQFELKLNSYKIGSFHLQHAITTKVTAIRKGRLDSRKKLLDYSIDKYGEQLIRDIRTLLRILILHLPLPIYYLLYAQTGSRWIFQAKQMNGDLGFYVVKPNQFQLVEPLMLLIMIPIFNTVIYAVLRRIGIRRPLQKMVIGGASMGVSFVFAGLVQYNIESSAKNTVHMLWQLPQYFAVVVGDIMFNVVGKKILQRN